ncbi:UNVERIFIED_CONTAM: hypothetical protein FKN15_053137 [Acipenser sinensis]
MFLGELSCLVLFHVLLCHDRRSPEPKMNMGQTFNPLYFFPPAMCDMTATCIMYVAWDVMQWDLQSVVSFLLSRTPTPELGTRPLVVLLAALLILFLWYCYRVGTEDQDLENGGGGAARRGRRRIGTMRGLSIPGSAAGLDHSDLGIIPIGGPEHGGYFSPIMTSPPFPDPGQASPGNRKLYRNLQEYAKRYSWAGMGRIHKGVREQVGAAFTRE